MSEVRALLLTDVVDSTKLSEALGDAAMAEVWAAHDRVARDLLPRWRGREIDKTDGMLLLFDSAADALAYAMDYHAALATLSQPLRARAGLHVGAVILRENAAEDVARGAKPLEVDGLAKPMAARVMSIARGGQTLLTAEAREDLAKTAMKLQSHGHWVVKGVADPIELFEAGAPDSRFVPPADTEKVHRVIKAGDWWMPVSEIPNNLPHQGTSFIGRERELDEVKVLLTQARLVTVIGMGGMGKTRLTLQVAAEQIQLFPDGVWFLDLAPLGDPALVAAEAARVLDVPQEPGRSPLQAICAHLKSRRVLLVLDNCEHLIKPSAELAHAIVRACPFACMLASSREALHVPGERAYPILPLPLPGREDGIDALARSTAVQLFVARARSHKPSFELNPREAPAIADLVARLEGIPLALELAAARVRSLSLADINSRLKDRYKLLVGGSRVLQQRQQTLRALVDWSYELLNPAEQALLARLSVFAGGFDLDAAEQVCASGELQAEDVLDLLASLVEKSLVAHDEREAGSRYRMLETIRDYAREKLEQSGDAAATAARHGQHFLAVAKLANEGLRGPDQADWVQRVESELDNIRAASALALAGGVDPAISVKLVVHMQGFWILRGYTSEGRRLVRAALALPEVEASAHLKGHALYVGAALADSQSDHAEARQMLETCLELRRGLGDEVNIAATLSWLSQARLQAGDVEGAASSETEALQIFRRHGDREGEAIGLLHLGQIAGHAEDHDQAQRFLSQGLAIAREIRYQEVEGECELLLGDVALAGGDRLRARQCFGRSLEVCRAGGDKRGEANALWRLGELDLLAADIAAARTQLGQALKAFRAADMWKELLGCLEAHAMLLRAESQLAAAVRIAATATTSRERLGLVRSAAADRLWQRRLAELRENLPDDEFIAAWNDAWDGWEVDDAVRSALAVARPEAATDRPA